MKVSLGFILLVLGVLGIARGGIDAPQQNMGQVLGGGPAVASLVTLAAALLLVGGLLILARTGRFSFGGSRGHGDTYVPDETARETAHGHAADKIT